MQTDSSQLPSEGSKRSGQDADIGDRDAGAAPATKGSASEWRRNQPVAKSMEREMRLKAAARAHRHELHANAPAEEQASEGGDSARTVYSSNLGGEDSQKVYKKREQKDWEDSSDESDLDKSLLAYDAQRAALALPVVTREIEQIRLPSSIKDKYTFTEVIKSDDYGDRLVYLCEVTLEEAARRHSVCHERQRAAPKKQMSRQISPVESEEMQDLRRKCIVKVWRKGALSPEATAEWLANQLKLLRMKPHPNLMLPRHILEDERAYYLEADVVETGCTMLQLMLNDASFSAKQVKRIIRGILRGLRHLHFHGLAHRDIKPENVLLEWHDATGLLAKKATLPSGWRSSKGGVSGWVEPTRFKNAWRRHELKYVAKLIDFDTVSGPDSKTICGTPGYMAPEAYVKNAGLTGDLFSVGLLAYMFIACESPCHDAVAKMLRGEDFSNTTPSMRLAISEAVTEAVEQNVVLKGPPWSDLPAICEFCRMLLHVNPHVRGENAGEILMAAMWFRGDKDHASASIHADESE